VHVTRELLFSLRISVVYRIAVVDQDSRDRYDFFDARGTAHEARHRRLSLDPGDRPRVSGLGVRSSEGMMYVEIARGSKIALGIVTLPMFRFIYLRRVSMEIVILPFHIGFFFFSLCVSLN
jgi:hypothetical protein